LSWEKGAKMYSMLFGLTFVITAPAIKPKTPPETIVGEWQVESIQVGEQPPNTQGADKWIFREDGTKSIFQNGESVGDSNYSLNPKEKDWLDLVSMKMGILTHQCRFAVKGDTLTLVVGHDRNRRPDHLNPAPTATVWIMKRIKPK
jgi:hypothetical protein